MGTLTAARVGVAVAGAEVKVRLKTLGRVKRFEGLDRKCPACPCNGRAASVSTFQKAVEAVFKVLEKLGLAVYQICLTV